MDVMSLHQESGYRRLYRWVRDEARKFEEESSEPEYNSLLNPALKALQERPILLSYCLDEIGNSRCKAIVKAFITALTIAGPNGMPRPIELHAHDPLRYVGDMLAWIHQTLASEKEFLHGLVGDDSFSSDVMHLPGQPQQHQPQLHLATSSMIDKFADLTASNVMISNNPKIASRVKILNTAFEGVCKPFKLRVEQVLMTQPGVVTDFRLANLLDFYARTITNLMGTSESPLPLVFNECKHDCLKVFYDKLKDDADRLQRAPPPPPSDLSPPPQIRDAVNKLKELISTFNASLVPLNERAREFGPILQAIVEPLLHTCTLSATAGNSGGSAGTRMDLSSMAVYMVNCISSLVNVLSAYEFTASRIEMLTAQIEAHMDTLVEEQTTQMLQSCGLAQKIGVIQYRDPSKGLLSAEPGMERAAVTESAKAFEGSMVDPGVLVIPQCDKLVNPKLRSTARKNIATMLCNTYETFHAAVMLPQNGYENPMMIFKYSPEQVRTILEAQKV
jgi:hypothetical protein